MRLETKFQDKEFELGEVVRAEATIYHDENKVVVRAEKASGGFSRFEYNSIKDFTDHWEDAPEEPKGFWLINILGIVEYTHGLPEHEVEMLKKIGNHFETEEQAIKARDKLFAWQRIEEDSVSLHWQDEKDGKFSVWGQFYGNMLANDAILNIHRKDLDLLFGGEE